MRTLHYNARFIELASEINTSMPRYWVQQVQDRLNQVGQAVNGSRILVLGIAYQKDVSDTDHTAYTALDLAGRARLFVNTRHLVASDTAQEPPATAEQLSR